MLRPALVILAAALLGPGESQQTVLSAADSYAVYSALMNSQTAGKPQKGLWMIAASMSAYKPGEPCVFNKDQTDERWEIDRFENPHVAIQVPPPDQARFREILDDFDQHCHESFPFRAEAFTTEWPVRVLTAKEQKQFTADLMPEDPARLKKWPKATGLQTFSRVFFNKDRTLAMVRSFFYCGLLCATWEWQVLEKQDGVWKVLPWKHQVTVS